MISRQTLRKVMLYVLSIAIFWNALIAIRAYRFTHFQTFVPLQTTQTAGVFDYFINRFTGQQYYKIPTKTFPALPYSVIQLTTSNNLKLEGWHIPNYNAKGTVIIMHGLNGNKETMLAEAYSFQKVGYSTLLIDFRAHGNSEGTKCTLGLDEAEDVKLAYEYIKNTGEKNIVLYGASMGAATISYAMHKYNLAATKVILDMPFASYSQLIEKFFKDSKYPTQPTSTMFTFWAGVFNKSWFFSMKPSEYVKDIKCPTLLQWGRTDGLVPQQATELIYANIGATNKTLKIYDQCGHEHFCTKQKEEWDTTVTNFLQN